VEWRWNFKAVATSQTSFLCHNFFRLSGTHLMYTDIRLQPNDLCLLASWCRFAARARNAHLSKSVPAKVAGAGKREKAIGQFQQRPMADYGSGPSYDPSGPGIRNPEIAGMGMGGMPMQALHAPPPPAQAPLPMLMPPPPQQLQPQAVQLPVQRQPAMIGWHEESGSAEAERKRREKKDVGAN
jgi:hypothetical protein